MTYCLTPSAGTTCGIAEYALSLARAGIHPIRIVTALPERLEPGDVVDIQFEDAIFAGRDIAADVRRARASGARVVATMHSFWPEVGYPWLADVDDVVCLSDRTFDRMSARVRGPVIHRLPHGIEPWLGGAAKRKPARTVAVFGFFAEHKGFEAVYQATRRLPRCEMLMFSHEREGQADRRWYERAEAGLLTWHRDMPPIEAVRGELAAHADVIAFWYDEMNAGATSGAARVALSTGVPVLTSSTGWFADLAGAVHQPDDLTAGLERLLTDRELRALTLREAERVCRRDSWSSVAAAMARIRRGGRGLAGARTAARGSDGKRS